MNENSYFNADRFRYLLIRQLRFNIQTLIIGFGAVAGLIIFILSMRVIFGQASLNTATFYGVTMPFFFVGGFVFTSTIFSELRTPQRGYLYLTLPVSTLEKLIVSWFITSVLYIATAIVVMFLMNALLMALSVIFSTSPVPVFNLFDPIVLRMFAVYMVNQSIFLLGSVYFKGANFLKTLLSLFVISLIIAIYTSITARLIVFHHFSSIRFDHDMPENWLHFFQFTFAPVIKALFWYFLAPFFLVVSYFSLKERQV